MRKSWLSVGVTVSCACSLGVLLSTAALARPPARAGQTDAPLVGRMLTHDGIVDLTRDTLAEGGPAHELREGLARVIADAEVVRVDRASAVGTTWATSHAQPEK
jgi:hypothetical protein